MTDVLTPTSLTELTNAVRGTGRVLAAGALTKPRLAETDRDCTRLSTLGLKGILEYEPEEYTITALAGTPMKELAAVLDQYRQYLPFDPLFLESGCTLGGTISAGTSGPGRFRFGGIRDFLLGVRFVDGVGRLLRVGAKVVKNAAGFDLPKFLVGSLGRFGVIAEATLKVFPKSEGTLTVSLTAESAEAALAILTQAARGRWEWQAMDLPPEGGKVLARLAGPASALEILAKDVLAHWPGEILPARQADAVWADLGNARWAYPEGALIKSPITPGQVIGVLRMVQSLADARVHISAGGNVAWISVPSARTVPGLDEALRGLGLSGLVLRGEASLWLGIRQHYPVSRAVKEALDPTGRFPLLDELQS